MKTFPLQQGLVTYLSDNLAAHDYYLLSAGRGVGRVRMAARALAEIQGARPDLEADYHAYTAVSAARSAVDAVACWLNFKYGVNLPLGPKVSLTNDGYWRKVKQVVPPGMRRPLQACRALARGIDPLRQRAQHKEGLFVQMHSDGNYYLVGAVPGVTGDRGRDQELGRLCADWADTLQNGLDELIALAAEETSEPTAAG